MKRPTFLLTAIKYLSPRTSELWSHLQAGVSPPFHEVASLYQELYLTGAVKIQNNRVVIRNRIYESAVTQKRESNII